MALALLPSTVVVPSHLQTICRPNEGGGEDNTALMCAVLVAAMVQRAQMAHLFAEFTSLRQVRSPAIRPPGLITLCHRTC